MNAALFQQAGIAGANLVQIAADIEMVEQALQDLTASGVEVTQKVGRHTLESGGKRLRPVFLLLSARAAGGTFESDRAVRLGACMELIHMATLIHDDVIDEAATRRGRPTAARTFGNTAAILSGDVMLARAMDVLAEDGDIRVIRTASKMVVEMAEGEAREVEVRYDFDLSLEDHLVILRMKTAAFVECCCRIGSYIGGVADETAEAMAAYGHHLGIAFQIVDDILDYRGKQAKTGKPKATDYKEGCATLPLIFMRDKATHAELEKIKAGFGTESADALIDEVLALMEKYDVFTQADALAREHLESAMAALKTLPASSHRDLLESAGHFVLQRSS